MCFCIKIIITVPQFISEAKKVTLDQNVVCNNGGDITDKLFSV